MGGYILFIGYLSVAGVLTPMQGIGNVYFPTKNECESTTHITNLVESYRPVVQGRYPNREFRIWCEPVKTAK